MTRFKANIALLVITLGWGASFILTKNSLGELSTFNFLFVRFIIAFVLSSIIFIKDMIKIDKDTIKYGMILGIILFSSFAFQTVGLGYTSVSKSAFITGFNVVLVPIFSAFLIKTIPNRKTILSVIIAVIGLGMLTINGDSLKVNIGDIYTFICAVLFAVYVIYVSKYNTKVKTVPMAIIQMGVVSILSLITSLVIEKPILPTTTYTWVNMIILSVVCTSIAYIVINVAQKYTTPSNAALIYTGEPVFAAIFGYIVTGEILSPKGMIGASLILTGMIISEVKLKKIIKGRFIPKPTMGK